MNQVKNFAKFLEENKILRHFAYYLKCELCGQVLGSAYCGGSKDPSNDLFLCLQCAAKFETAANR